ncbi:MAG TPA: L-threonylcarbamoyladenylate synthase [Candidatus Saccharimonadales bacterium]|nr:L-threonylcarbamoyladenylate synthase [Candidatus Saccharimonadales bacterium]
MQLFKTLTDARLVRALKQGRVGVLPTDTVYGIVCSALNKPAVARLYRVKQRENKPGTVIAANASQLAELGISAEAINRVAHLWPNPVSVVLPADDELFYLHRGLGSLAVRIPASEPLRTLLEQTGPLLTSSANQPTETPAATVPEAQKYFGEAVDFYTDAGKRLEPVPSTLVRLEPNSELTMLRQGAGILKEGAKR